MSRVLIPVPSYGFDPTEVAIPWQLLSQDGHDIVFATPDGEKASADQRMLSGDGLGIWKHTLRARQDAIDACHEMENDNSFRHPVNYADVIESHFDATFLPGGHDKGVKDFLESPLLQKAVADFFSAAKPVAAICHGVVLAARSIDPDTGKSVIFNYKTTALLKSQERLAYHLTRLWLKDYYLTYPELTVEDEVKAALSDDRNFVTGPTPLSRDSIDQLGKGFVVRDRNYVSARWPGDIYNITLKFMELLNQHDDQSLITDRV